MKALILLILALTTTMISRPVRPTITRVVTINQGYDYCKCLYYYGMAEPEDTTTMGFFYGDCGQYQEGDTVHRIK